MDGFGDQRIGAEERDSAVRALQAHYTAGRLTPEEYEDRSVAASKARTWADVAPLFADLPEPRPMPVTVDLRRAVAEPAPQGLLPMSDRARETVMALTPFVALVLFFVTDFTWLWFLAIPVVGIVLYGPDRGRDRHRRR